MGLTDDQLKEIELNRDNCKTQARFYELAAYDGCDMREFSDRYLRSHFCKNRIEVVYSAFQREDAMTCLEFIYPEIGIEQDPSSEKIFDPDIAYWIGYTYHQLFCETGVRGEQLAEKVPFERLLLNYAAHHTLDEFYSVNKLCGYYGLEINELYRGYEEYQDGLGS